jgi:hypothetical protein
MQNILTDKRKRKKELKPVQLLLTAIRPQASVTAHGGVGEWTKPAASKTAGSLTGPRQFESDRLRQIESAAQ